MRTLTKLMTGVAAAAALAVTAGSAQAALTFTALYSYNGGPLTAMSAVASTPTSGWFMNALVGNFANVTLQGQVTSSPLFGSTSSAVTALAAGDLDLFMIVQGLTGPLGSPEAWSTSITQNDLPLGWTVDTQAWLDPNNGQAVGSSLGNLHFLGTGGLNPGSGTTATTINTGAGPYSISTEYHIHATGASDTQVLSNTQVYALGAVPEPATWGLMLVGFGGAGAMLRRRRAVAAAA
jgi:hypothetical protein